MGTWTWKVRAIDVAGNVTSWSTTKNIDIVAPDTTPPTPNPSTWATKPYATGTSSIRMVATTASDPSGVEYYFDETSGNPGGSDSGWQNDSAYEDTGLQASTTYTYRVRTRDKSPSQNVGNYSTSEQATTQPPPDTQGPYAPGSIQMSTAFDTAGQSTSDGITYIGNPQFQWTKPADRPASGASGTKDYYQWAVTLPTTDPWTGPRAKEGYTSSTAVQPGTLSDGSYKFWVQAQDNANNWGDWGQATFRIDTVAPTVPGGLANPGGNSSTTDTTPNVTWTASTDAGGSGVWTYDVKFVKGGTTYTFSSK